VDVDPGDEFTGGGMSQDSEYDPSAVYDRELLLFGARREAVLGLMEVQRYGVDSYGNPDHVSVYGMRPADWYARGIRLLGRTVVECTGDALAQAIAEDVAAVARFALSSSGALVIDPFVGSGNTLYWIQRCLPGSRGVGFELDAALWDLTAGNLAVLGSPLEVVNIDYAEGLAGVSARKDQLVIAFVAPPWGKALDSGAGLDLRRTQPPVAQVVDVLFQRFASNPILLAMQAYERIVPASLVELVQRCDWWDQRLYDLNEVGRNHGVLLGTRGWVPPARPLDPRRETT
jgi:hypothetical protein